MQKRNLDKAALQFYQNYTHAEIYLRKFAAHPQNTLLLEDTSGEMLLQIKRTLKDFSYKKILFTVFKRNLLILKMNK